MTKKHNLLSIVYTVALVVVVFVAAPVANGEEKKESDKPKVTVDEAKKTCADLKKDDDSSFNKYYDDQHHCLLVMIGQRAPKGAPGDTCKEINDNLVEATKEFNQACAGAGLPTDSGSCESALNACFSAMGSSSKSTADTLLSSLGLGGGGGSSQGSNACHTQTSEQQNEQYEKEQERIQEQIRQANEDIKQAQADIIESRRLVNEAEAQKLEAELTAKNEVRLLGLTLPRAIRQQNEESFNKLMEIRREIDKQRNLISKYDHDIATSSSKKAEQLLGLLVKCEDELKDNRAELRKAYEARVAATGGAPQVRSFNEIYQSSQPMRNILQTAYRKCMDRANKVREIYVTKANNDANHFNNQRSAAENEIARLEEAKEAERHSLTQRIGEEELNAEIQRQMHIEAIDAAQRNLDAVTQTEAQNQAMLQNQINAAQAKLNMGSNGMLGLGTGGGGIMGIFSGVLGAIANSGGGSSGGKPAQGVSHTMADAMNKLQAKRSYENHAEITGCDNPSLSSGGRQPSSGRGGTPPRRTGDAIPN